MPKSVAVHLVFPSFQSSTYHGTTSIVYQTVEEGQPQEGHQQPSTLLFHADQSVTITNPKVLLGKKMVKILNISMDLDMVGRMEEDDSMVSSGTLRGVRRIHLAESSSFLPGSMVEVTMDFCAPLRRTMFGCYRDATATIITTHFEVSHARDAMPCVDDPHVRVFWTMTITPPPNALITLSNQEETRSRSRPGVVSFQTTRIPLPAYVIAWFVSSQPPHICEGRLQRAGESSSLGLGVKIIGPSKSVPAARFPYDFALSVLQIAVTQLSEYFGTPVPGVGRCLQVVVVPDTPIAGMENHGLIFINAKLGLPTVGSCRKMNPSFDALAKILVHEVAHHWIGNGVGFSFGTKEGICLVLEEVFGEVVLGRPLCTKFLALHGDAPITREAVIDGNELTGVTYQQSQRWFQSLVARHGWTKIQAALRLCVQEENVGIVVSDDALIQLLLDL